MKIKDKKLLATIENFRRTVVDDMRVDKAETLELLEFARPLVHTYKEMAEFVTLLEKVLEDGKVTHEESVKVGAYLAWLTREEAAPVEEKGFLGRLFKLGRNRTRSSRASRRS